MFSCTFLVFGVAGSSRPNRLSSIAGFVRGCAIACLTVALLLSPAIAQDAAQQPPTSKPPEPQPKPPASTAPQVKEVLPSYEGQNVSSVEIAGRPDLDTRELMPQLAIKAGDKFSRAKVNESIATLKSLGKFQDVQLQVVPDVNGVRVLLVLQPGVYFGMYDFPGAIGHGFSYTRLLQVSNYPPEGPYTQADVTNATNTLVRFFQRNGYFEAKVEPRVKTFPKDQLVN